MDASRQMQTTITSILNHVGECKKKFSLTPFSILLLATLICIYGYCNIRIRGHTRTPTPLPHTHTHTYIYIYIHTHTHIYIYIYTYTHTKQKCNQPQRICITVSVHNSSCDTTQIHCNWNKLLLWCDVIQSGKYELPFRKKITATSTPTHSP
jgi:hypothetical protein